MEERLCGFSTWPVVDDDTSSSASTDELTPPAVQPERPKLLARKSTMSPTIEQRLREIALVHQMIKAAMAEDGDEEDEVKEEYGKQADEELAELRSKLEEARRNEGKPPLNADHDESIRVMDVSAKPADGDAELKAKLALSQQEVSF